MNSLGGTVELYYRTRQSFDGPYELAECCVCGHPVPEEVVRRDVVIMCSQVCLNERYFIERREE